MTDYYSRHVIVHQSDKSPISTISTWTGSSLLSSNKRRRLYNGYSTVQCEAQLLVQVGKPHTPTSSLLTCGSWDPKSAYCVLYCVRNSYGARTTCSPLARVNSNELTSPFDVCKDTCRSFLLTEPYGESFILCDADLTKEGSSFGVMSKKLSCPFTVSRRVQASPCRSVTDGFR